MAGATITFGDVAENHAGMQKLGAMAAAGLGRGELAAAQARFEAAGFACELVDLVARAGVGPADFGGADVPGAWVLLVRGGCAALLPAGADALWAEQAALAPDTRALMRGRVVTKRARHNLCFADAAQAPDFPAGRGSVVAFGAVPLTAAVRAALPAFFGPQTAGLMAEGNYYYDLAQCGIGFHGDGERRLVLALRLGGAFPLHYQWFFRHAPVGRRVVLDPRHGDLYAMSAKAVGTDWRRSAMPTLRHAAGAPKYLRV